MEEKNISILDLLVEPCVAINGHNYSFLELFVFLATIHDLENEQK